jgi:hypothetical protein
MPLRQRSPLELGWATGWANLCSRPMPPAWFGQIPATRRDRCRRRGKSGYPQDCHGRRRDSCVQPGWRTQGLADSVPQSAAWLRLVLVTGPSVVRTPGSRPECRTPGRTSRAAGVVLHIASRLQSRSRPDTHLALVTIGSAKTSTFRRSARARPISTVIRACCASLRTGSCLRPIVTDVDAHRAFARVYGRPWFRASMRHRIAGDDRSKRVWCTLLQSP